MPAKTPITFELDLTIERSALKNTLSVTLNAIFFQRALGTVTARSVELLGLAFVAIQDSNVASLIDSKVDAFVRESPASGGRILLRLSEKPHANKRPGWFSSREDEGLPFEEWMIKVTVQSGATERERSQIDSTTRKQLTDFQLKMLNFCNEQKDHIPPITNPDAFPIEIILNPPLLSRPGQAEGYIAGLRRFIDREETSAS